MISKNCDSSPLPRPRSMPAADAGGGDLNQLLKMG
jgi:hypothetical protein